MKFRLNTQTKIQTLIERTIRECRRFNSYDDFYDKCAPYYVLLPVGSSNYNEYVMTYQMKAYDESLYLQRRDEYEQVVNEQILELNSPNLEAIKSLEKKNILKILDMSTYKVKIKYLLEVKEKEDERDESID